uniref:DEP domain-containing protein n=1 Tax=Pyramimonas obovata TaxID=1411642 RepID=A0A7S0N8A5_9CHLO|mmetsp:Transcript_21510/g.47187  ORF Transcript_21510/g.47187 Transcript_21510/m.47187 type:complete len:198 (+) Transcript_21510:1006-1599(+)
MEECAAIAAPCRAHALSREDLRALVQRMAAGIPVRDHLHYMLAYEACFTGREAVEWMVGAGEAESAERALCLGNQLLRANLIFHIYNENPFENATIFYRFNLDPTRIPCVGRKIIHMPPPDDHALIDVAREARQEGAPLREAQLLDRMAGLRGEIAALHAERAELLRRDLLTLYGAEADGSEVPEVDISRVSCGATS